MSQRTPSKCWLTRIPDLNLRNNSSRFLLNLKRSRRPQTRTSRSRLMLERKTVAWMLCARSGRLSVCVHFPVTSRSGDESDLSGAAASATFRFERSKRGRLALADFTALTARPENWRISRLLSRVKEAGGQTRYRRHKLWRLCFNTYSGTPAGSYLISLLRLRPILDTVVRRCHKLGEAFLAIVKWKVCIFHQQRMLDCHLMAKPQSYFLLAYVSIECWIIFYGRNSLKGKRGPKRGFSQNIIWWTLETVLSNWPV